MTIAETGPSGAIDLKAGPERVIRNCVVCGSESYTDKFSFTFDFLTKIRGHDGGNLRLRGWSEDVTSTIVKCSHCGCNYIRDVVLTVPEYRTAQSEHTRTLEGIEKRKQGASDKRVFQNYASLDRDNWVVRYLLILAAQRQQRDIRFLDFGAGEGRACNMARVSGIKDVVAYDPFNVENIQDIFDVVNFPGIKCVRSREELTALGPFDAVVFQSAIEHVLDPRGEMQLIFDLMSRGGYLYVNNPVMDLDKELDQLRNAKKIVKKDRISHYHIDHYNYMMPRHFSQIIKDVGFKITPLVHYPPVPLAKGMLGQYLLRNAKYAIRSLQNILGIPYKRNFYILRKPH
jgi:2-polyprenyl-3-methyl-5-hydroxy-6-metoxy-1,4-benzoquinol methylase